MTWYGAIGLIGLQLCMIVIAVDNLLRSQRMRKFREELKAKYPSVWHD